MKARIGRFEMEGTPEEMAALMESMGGGEAADNEHKPISKSMQQHMLDRSMPAVKSADKLQMGGNKFGGRYSNIRRGQPPAILARLFMADPELQYKTFGEIKNAYLKEIGAVVANNKNLRKNISRAKSLVANRKRSLKQKENWKEKIASRGEKVKIAATDEKVRTVHSPNVVSRGIIEEIVKQLPGTFGMTDVLSRLAIKLNVPYSGKRYMYYNSTYMRLVRICGKPYKVHGKAVFSNPFKEGAKPIGIDSVMGLPPAADVADSKEVIGASDDGDYTFEPVMITADTLDVLISNHTSFGVGTMVGMKNKNGHVMGEADATYAFKHLMENLSALQKLYPGRKLSISGSGRYKAIEVR